MQRVHNQPRVLVLLLAIGAWASCVSYDPTGPSAAAINGTYTGKLVTAIKNDLEVRYDTTSVTLALRDSAYRGRFFGDYRLADGESGRVAGTLYSGEPVSRVRVSHFADWPPVAHVAYLAGVYTNCDFGRATPMYVEGTLRGDTLVFAGSAPIPCTYALGGTVVDRDTELDFQVVGLRVKAR